MLNLQGLQTEERDESSVVSENYDLLKESQALTWYGDTIHITRPGGLSEVTNINFRSWTGEMLPFTSMELPALRCSVLLGSIGLDSLNLSGASTPYGRTTTTMGTVFEFSKAWTYEEGENSQVVYNVRECLQEANRRLRLMYPYAGSMYAFRGPYFHDLVEPSVVLPRSDVGSGVVGFINDPNGKKFKLYTGGTPFENKEITLTNNLESSATRYIRQLCSNHNNTIVFACYGDYRVADGFGNANRVEIITKPGTENETHLSTTLNNYLINDALNPVQTPIQGGVSGVKSRMMGVIFSTITTDGTDSVDALLLSPMYAFTSATFGKMTLIVLDSIPMPIEIGALNTWLDNNVDFSQSYPTGARYDFHTLAFATRYESDTLYLYIFGALPYPNRHEQTDEEHSAGNLVNFYLFRCTLDISGASVGSFECLASLEGRDSSTFINGLYMDYQYGADLGASYFDFNGDDVGRNYINFGMKYVVRWRPSEDPDSTPELGIRTVFSSLWDFSDDLDEFVYLVQCGNSSFQSYTGIQQAYTAGQTSAVLYANGFTPYTGADIVDGLHWYRTVWHSGHAVAWIRNKTDMVYVFNWEVLNAFSAYGLGGENDTVNNIEITHIVRISETSTPASTIYQGLNSMATISPEDVDADYITGMLGMDLSGTITTPTLLMVDSLNSSKYYQGLFIVRVWTEPYYFDIYSDFHGFDNPGSSQFSLVLQQHSAQFNQINSHVLNTLEALILMKYEYNDISLRCLNFPSHDNIVFHINEIARIDFKRLQTTTDLSRLAFQVVDSSGNIISRDALAVLYGSLVLSIDWM